MPGGVGAASAVLNRFERAKPYGLKSSPEGALPFQPGRSRPGLFGMEKGS
jgi:hypothetical protein